MPIQVMTIQALNSKWFLVKYEVKYTTCIIELILQTLVYTYALAVSAPVYLVRDNR